MSIGSVKRVAIVTGAGSGIGRAVALELLKQGYAVALAGRRAERLEETTNLAGSSSPAALAIRTDVSDKASVDALFQQTQEAFGRVDVLFNNAGVNMPSTPLEDVALEDWQKIVDVNLTGMFLCTQTAFRVMKEQDPRGGRIINNGSISAHAPRAEAIAYTATKHAVTGLTKAASLEGRKYHIACGQIDIGNAATAMSQRMEAGALQADGSVAVEPRFDVRHVAEAVAYMANLPLDANVLTMTLMATKMPYVGRG